MVETIVGPRVVVAGLAIAALAGCLGSDGPSLGGGTLDSGLGALLAMDGATAPAGEPLVWVGPKLAAGGPEDRRQFDLSLPSGFWAETPGALVVSIRWPLLEQGLFEGDQPDLDLVLYDAGGSLIARGVEPEAVLGVRGIGAPIPGSASVVLLPMAAAGSYSLEVLANTGAAAYEGSLHLQARMPDPGPAHDLLPNLVALPANLLQVDSRMPTEPVMAAAGKPGCTPADAGVVRVEKCLRFDLNVGNVGEGDLELRLPKAEGAGSLANDGRFIQRIYRTDHSFREVVAGPAAFHAAHGHFHASGADEVDLYVYDDETGTRGAHVRDFAKQGLCYADLTLAALGRAWTTLPRFDGSGCLDPTLHGDWVTGLAPNWVDMYPPEYPDQFLDITDVPDGVYELAIRANGDRSITEASLEDNEASTIFRLTGTEVEILRTLSPIEGGPPAMTP